MQTLGQPLTTVKKNNLYAKKGEKIESYKVLNIKTTKGSRRMKDKNKNKEQGQLHSRRDVSVPLS